MTERNALADLSAKLGQAAAELTTRDVNVPEVSQQLADIAAQAGGGSFFGTIAFVGQSSDGSFQVQFNDTSSNTGFSSLWPQWAYELAKTALLNSKNVLIFSNGPPFGVNLVSVFIFA
jgi:hypothetical protein